MTSAVPGPGIFPAEVAEVSGEGFVLCLGSERLYVSYSDFPWFRGASRAGILRVERPAADHLYWPALDIDLSVESVRDPSRFPLVSRA